MAANSKYLLSRMRCLEFISLYYIHACMCLCMMQLKRVRQRLEQQSATCESYEAQLQRVQEQMLEELDEKDQELSRLREECSKARAGVMRERKAKEELRHQMEDACEQSKLQVCFKFDLCSLH